MFQTSQAPPHGNVSAMESLSSYRHEGAETFRLPHVVKAYEARPGYPTEAVNYMLEHACSTSSYEGSVPCILDAGAGTGLVTEGIMASGKLAHIIALDRSEDMAAVFQNKFIGAGIPFLVGDFDAMPFAGNTFDTVIFGTALHWGSPSDLPGELYRILQPGGSVISIGNMTRPQTEFTEIIGRLPGQAFKCNPMTSDSEKINLGSAFTFECFQRFPNDVYLSPEMFTQLLMSIDPIQTAPPELSCKAWSEMQSYANRNAVGGFIPVPFDTMVRIARVIK